MHWTLESIAQELTTCSVPTKTGKSERWTHLAVARIHNRERGVPTDLPDAAARDGEFVASGIA